MHGSGCLYLRKFFRKDQTSAHFFREMQRWHASRLCLKISLPSLKRVPIPPGGPKGGEGILTRELFEAKLREHGPASLRRNVHFVPNVLIYLVGMSTAGDRWLRS